MELFLLSSTPIMLGRTGVCPGDKVKAWTSTMTRWIRLKMMMLIKKMKISRFSLWKANSNFRSWAYSRNGRWSRENPAKLLILRLSFLPYWWWRQITEVSSINLSSTHTSPSRLPGSLTQDIITKYTKFSSQIIIPLYSTHPSFSTSLSSQEWFASWHAYVYS